MKALIYLVFFGVAVIFGYSLYVQDGINEIGKGNTPQEKEVLSQEMIQAQSLPKVPSPSGAWESTSATCGEKDLTDNIPSHILFNGNAYTWQTEFKYLLAGKKMSEVGTFNIKGETIIFTNAKDATITYNIKYNSPNEIVFSGKNVGDCSLTMVFVKTG